MSTEDLFGAISASDAYAPTSSEGIAALSDAVTTFNNNTYTAKLERQAVARAEKARNLGIEDPSSNDRNNYSPKQDPLGLKREAYQQELAEKMTAISNGMHKYSSRDFDGMDPLAIVDQLNAADMDIAMGLSGAQGFQGEVQPQTPAGMQELAFRSANADMNPEQLQAERALQGNQFENNDQLSTIDDSTATGYLGNLAAGAAAGTYGLIDSGLRALQTGANSIGLESLAGGIQSVRGVTDQAADFYDKLENTDNRDYQMQVLQDHVQDADGFFETVNEMVSSAPSLGVATQMAAESLPYMIGLSSGIPLAAATSAAALEDNVQANKERFVQEEGREPTGADNAFLVAMSVVQTGVDLAGDKFLGGLGKTALLRHVAKSTKNAGGVVPKNISKYLDRVGPQTLKKAALNFTGGTAGEFVAEGGADLLGSVAVKGTDIDNGDVASALTAGTAGAVSGGVIAGPTEIAPAVSSAALIAKDGIKGISKLSSKLGLTGSGKAVKNLTKKNKEYKQYVGAPEAEEGGQQRDVLTDAVNLIEGKDWATTNDAYEKVKKGEAVSTEELNNIYDKQEQHSYLEKVFSDSLKEIDEEIANTTEPAAVKELMAEKQELQTVLTEVQKAIDKENAVIKKITNKSNQAARGQYVSDAAMDNVNSDGTVATEQSTTGTDTSVGSTDTTGATNTTEAVDTATETTEASKPVESGTLSAEEKAAAEAANEKIEKEEQPKNIDAAKEKQQKEIDDLASSMDAEQQKLADLKEQESTKDKPVSAADKKKADRSSKTKKQIKKLEGEERVQALRAKRLTSISESGRDSNKALNRLQNTDVTGIKVTEGYNVEVTGTSEASVKGSVEAEQIASTEKTENRQRSLRNLLKYATALHDKVVKKDTIAGYKAALADIQHIRQESQRYENKKAAKTYLDTLQAEIESKLDNAIVNEHEQEINEDQHFNDMYEANESSINTELFLRNYTSKNATGKVDNKAASKERVKNEQAFNQVIHHFTGLTKDSTFEEQLNAAIFILSKFQKGHPELPVDPRTGEALVKVNGKIDPNNAQQMAAYYHVINKAQDTLYRNTDDTVIKQELETYMDRINLANNLKKFPLEHTLVTSSKDTDKGKPQDPTNYIPDNATVEVENFGSITYELIEGEGTDAKNGADFHIVKSDGTDEILNNEYLAKKHIFKGETDLETEHLHVVYDKVRSMQAKMETLYADLLKQQGKKGAINVAGLSDIDLNPLRAFLQRTNKNGVPTMNSQILFPVLLGALQKADSLAVFNDHDNQKKLLGVESKDPKINKLLNKLGKKRPYSRGTNIKRFAKDIGSRAPRLPVNGDKAREGTSAAITQALGGLAVQVLDAEGLIKVEPVSIETYTKDLADMGTTLDPIEETGSHVNFITNKMFNNDTEAMNTLQDSLNTSGNKFDPEYATEKVSFKPHQSVKGYMESLAQVVGTTKEKLKEVATLLTQPFKFNKALASKMMTEKGYVEYLKLNLEGLPLKGIEALKVPADFDLTNKESALNKIIEQSVPAITKEDVFDQAQGLVQEITQFRTALDNLQLDYFAKNDIAFDPENLDFLDQEVFIPYKIPRNDRIHITAVGMDVQNSKFVRLMLKPKSDERSLVTKAKLTAKNTATEYAYALGTLFGLDEKSIASKGEHALETALAFIENALSATDKALLEQLQNLDQTEAELKGIISQLSFMNTGDAIFDEGELPKGVALTSLAEELANFGIYKETGKAYTSNIAVEVDGITNGFAIGLFQTPFLDEETLRTYLNRVGIYLEGDSATNYQEFRGETETRVNEKGETEEAPKNKDSYENLVDLSIEKLGGIFSSITNFLGFDETEDKKLIANRTAFHKHLNSDAGNYVRQVLEGVVKKTRDLAKPPWMTFNYSSGIPSIKNFVKQDLMAKTRELVASLYTMEEGSREYVETHEKLRDLVGPTDILTFTPADGKKGRSVTISKGSPTELTHKDLRELTISEFQERKIIDTIFSVFAEGMAQGLEQELGEIDKGRARMSSLVHSMFQNFHQILNAKVQRAIAESENGWLTENELKDIVKSLNHLLPTVEGFTGEKGRTDQLIQLYTIEVVPKRMGTETQHVVKVHMAGTSKGTQSLTLGVLGKSFSPIQKGTAAILTQMLDSAIMSRNLEAMKDVLHVHDASKSGPFGASQTGNTLNENTGDVLSQYNMYGDIVKSFVTKTQDAIKEMMNTGDILFTNKENTIPLFAEGELDGGIKQEHVERLTGYNAYMEYIGNPQYSTFFSLLPEALAKDLREMGEKLTEIQGYIAKELAKPVAKQDKSKLAKLYNDQDAYARHMSFGDLQQIGNAVFNQMKMDLDVIQERRNFIFKNIRFIDQYTGGVPNTAISVNGLEHIAKPEIALLDNLEAGSPAAELARERQQNKIFAKERSAKAIAYRYNALREGVTAAAKLIRDVLADDTASQETKDATVATEKAKIEDLLRTYSDSDISIPDQMAAILSDLGLDDVKGNQPMKRKLMQALKEALTKGATKFKEKFNSENVMESYETIAQNDNVSIDPEHDAYLRDFMSDIVTSLLGDKEVTVAETNLPTTHTVGMNVNGKQIVVNQTLSPTPADMSGRETLVHEWVHTILDPILKRNSTFKNQVTELRKQLLKKAPKKAILEALVGGKLTDETRGLANARFDYLFKENKNNSLNEFVAYMATNQGLRKLASGIEYTRPALDYGLGNNIFSNLVNHIMEAIRDFVTIKGDSVTEEFDNIVGALAGTMNRSVSETLEDVSNQVDNALQPITDVTTSFNEGFSELVEKYPEKFFDNLQKKIKEQFDGAYHEALSAQEIEFSKKMYMEAYEKNHFKEAVKRGYYLQDEKDRYDRVEKEIAAELADGFMRNYGLFATNPYFQAIRNNEDLTTLLTTMSNTDEKSLPVFKLFRKFKSITERLPASIEQATKKQLRKLLKGKTTKTERNGLTRLALFGDLQSLLNNTSIEGITEYINNKVVRKERIDKLKDQIEKKVGNKTVARGILTQTEGLAEHMQDGSRGVTKQLRNAKAIVTLNVYKNSMKDRNKHIKGKEKDLIKMVDELASLQSLDYLQKNNPDAFYAAKRLVNQEKAFFKEVLQVNKANVAKAKEKLFNKKGEDLLMLKGHTVEKYRHEIVSELAPVSHQLVYAEKGYEMIPMDGYTDTALYVKRGAFGSSHTMGIGTGMGLKAKGQSVTDILAVNDPTYKSGKKAEQAVKNVDAAESLQAYEEQILGKPKEKRPRIVPVVGPNGNVVSYNHVAGTNFRDNFLQRELDVIELTGAGRGTIERKIGHKEVLQGSRGLLAALDKDVKDNFHKERDEFVILSGNDFMNDGRVNPYKDLFYQLDPEVQQGMQTYDWKKYGGIPVRKKDLHTIAGSKKYTIAESTPIAHLQAIYPDVPIEYYTRLAEQLVKEFAVITKLDIVVRTPEVFLGNLTSNMMSLAMVGMSPYQSGKLIIEGFKHISKYEKLLAKQTVLENKRDAYAKGTAAYKRYNEEIKALKKELKSLPINPLIDQGLYTVINEDIDSTGVEGLIDTKIRDTREKYQGNKVFDTASTVVDWAYLSKRTPVFQFLSQGTNMMDFAARYAMYEHLKTVTNPKSKQYNKKTHKRLDNDDKIMEVLLNAFVYYDLPDGPMLEYANAMGLVLFTKYWLRIQKFLGYLAKNHPTELGKLAAVEMTLGQVDNVTSQFMLTKNLTYMFSSPWENFINTVTPMGIVNAKELLGF